MERGDKADLIRWWDALDAANGWVGTDFGETLRLARTCAHPDAKWLCALFPEEGTPSDEKAEAVLVAQGDDPRAQLLIVYVRHFGCYDGTWRAAAMGYAPAQADLGAGVVPFVPQNEQLEWAEKAAAQGDRNGLYAVVRCLEQLKSDDPATSKRMLDCCREAADLGQASAMYEFGNTFSAHDWRRMRWHGRSAAKRDARAARALQGAAVELLPELKRGNRLVARAVFEIGAAVRDHIVPGRPLAFCQQPSAEQLAALGRTVALHARCPACARRAIECWLGVARRLRIVKDIRQLIARRLWEERWAWIQQ